MPISPYVRDLRAVVGNARLLVPSVSGIIRDESGERVLLVQERDSERWSTPGGSLELDDTPADAVVREVWEETGLAVEIVRILGVYGGPEFVVHYANGDVNQYVSTMFECRVIGGEMQPDGDEIQDLAFFTLTEAIALPLSPWMRPVLARLYTDDPSTWFEAPTWRPPLTR